MEICRFLLCLPFYIITLLLTLLIILPFSLLTAGFGLISTIIYGDDLPGIKFNVIGD